MDCFEKSYGRRHADRRLVERDHRHALAYGAMPRMPLASRESRAHLLAAMQHAHCADVATHLARRWRARHLAREWLRAMTAAPAPSIIPTGADRWSGVPASAPGLERRRRRRRRRRKSCGIQAFGQQVGRQVRRRPLWEWRCDAFGSSACLQRCVEFGIVWRQARRFICGIRRVECVAIEGWRRWRCYSPMHQAAVATAPILPLRRSAARHAGRRRHWDHIVFRRTRR